MCTQQEATFSWFEMSMLQLSVWQHEVVTLPKVPVPGMHLDEHDWTEIHSDDFKYFSFLKFKIIYLI